MHSFAQNHDGFVLPNARFNPPMQPPNCSGLLTPPESPKSGKATLRTPNTATDFASFQEPSPRPCHGPSEFEQRSTQHDLSRVSETIYTIIEQVIEQKLAEAMGPLRLNIRRFDSENTDLQAQNDTLGFKVSRLEQQLHALQNISVAASSNLELISSLAVQLSSTINVIQNSNQTRSVPVPPETVASARHHEQPCNIQPQFCFKGRNSKCHRRSQTKSKKSRLVNYMLSKWRTGREDKD
ncbi:hypothetical protein PWT90_05479 [Aphanocladium album]|nr:hypothetical protein PWT90_05479 [Aphanocladium album]